MLPPSCRFIASLAFLATLTTTCGRNPIATSEETFGWAQWRGPAAQGVSPATGLPDDWTDAVMWKTAIEGRGFSSPVLWGNRIFLTTALRDGIIEGAGPVTHSFNGHPYIHPATTDADRHHTFKVLAIDTDSGALIWERTAYAGKVFDGRHSGGSFAAPSIATDGELLYAFFGPEGLYAYDLDGNPVWNKPIGEIATWGLGIGTSPILYHDLLILLCDENEGELSFMVALNKRTGEQIWEVEREISGGWSTPVLFDGPRGMELLTSGAELLISYDPTTGEKLWQLEGLLGTYVVHTPLLGDAIAVFTAGYPAKLTKAIALGSNTDSTPPHLAWSYEKGTGYVPSNLLYEDYVYLMSDSGILTCLDARTGKVIYEGGRTPIPGRYKASPIGYDNRILQISEDGDAFIIRAGPVHEVLAVNSLGEPVAASPAIAAGYLYIRGHEHLFKIGAITP